MTQKYKVFLDERFVLFTSEREPELPIIPYFEPKDFDALTTQISKNAQIICDNPFLALKGFFSKFEFIEAAGGLVQSAEKWLFIFRNGKWDLPKGKLEKMESPVEGAEREIREECGLEGFFEIKSTLPPTYHCYFLYGKNWLKKTHWFHFSYSGSKSTKPQKEEGIERVEWLNESELSQVRINTYGNIADLVNMI
jgi:8-oxo-dGTP pyrophosphatase MutT (NUDIX family)